MSADLIERLRDGLEGVTPGPWRSVRHFPDRGDFDGDVVQEMLVQPDGSIHGKFVIDPVDGIAPQDAAHIARCSPDNIRILLDALAAKDAALSEMRAEYLNASRDAMELATKLAAAEAQLERVRQALEQIGVVCLDNASPSCRHDLALKFVADVAARAASQDEGEERK